MFIFNTLTPKILRMCVSHDIDLYLFLDLVLKKSSLDPDLDLDQMVFPKELVLDNQQVTNILCVKIIIVITKRYTFYDIKRS